MLEVKKALVDEGHLTMRLNLFFFVCVCIVNEGAPGHMKKEEEKETLTAVPMN